MIREKGGRARSTKSLQSRLRGVNLNLHPSESNGIYAGGCLDAAPQDHDILIRVVNQQSHRLEYEQRQCFLLAEREGGRREGLGQEFAAPSSELDLGSGTDDGQGGLDDLRVVADIAQDKLAGVLELTDLIGNGKLRVGHG